MIHVFGALKNLWQGKKFHIDHWIFRLHYRFSVLLLLVFCIIISTKQYAGDPIKCARNSLDYSVVVENYCFITGTYTIPAALNLTPSQGAPHPGIVSHSAEKDSYRYCTYYQWVGFILFLQAIFFYFPHWLWKNIEGGKIAWLLERDIRFCSKDEKNKCRELIVDHLRNRWCKNRFYVVQYLACELLCLVNVIGQMQLLNSMFQGEFYYYGIEALIFLRLGPAGATDPFSRLFPKVTSCTYRYLGETGKVRSVSVLCVLAVNVVNEKVFLFLWFWFIALLIITSCTLPLKVVMFSVKSLRLLLLKSRFQNVRCEDFRVITESGNMADFLFIYLLGQNMDEIYFHDVMVDLVVKLQGKMQ